MGYAGRQCHCVADAAATARPAAACRPSEIAGGFKRAPASESESESDRLGREGGRACALAARALTESSVTGWPYGSASVTRNPSPPRTPQPAAPARRARERRSTRQRRAHGGPTRPSAASEPPATHGPPPPPPRHPSRRSRRRPPGPLLPGAPPRNPHAPTPRPAPAPPAPHPHPAPTPAVRLRRPCLRPAGGGWRGGRGPPAGPGASRAAPARANARGVRTRGSACRVARTRRWAAGGDGARTCGGGACAAHARCV